MFTLFDIECKSQSVKSQICQLNVQCSQLNAQFHVQFYIECSIECSIFNLRMHISECQLSIECSSKGKISESQNAFQRITNIDMFPVTSQNSKQMTATLCRSFFHAAKSSQTPYAANITQLCICFINPKSLRATIVY